MDLSTLITVAGLFLGLVVSNAAVFGDSLFATLAVPSSVEATGISQPVAEKMFAVTVANFGKTPSLLATPTVQTGSAPSLPMALAKPLNLQDVVYSIQAMVRDDAVNVAGAIVETEKKPGLAMYMVVTNPPDPPHTLTLNQPDGNAYALIEAAARKATEIISPFRVANTDIAAGLAGDPKGLERGKATAIAGLDQPWDPRVQGATEITLLHNLLAILARLDGDEAESRKQFALGNSVPGSEPASYGLIALNQAFFAMADRQPHRALQLFQEAEGNVAAVGSPGFAQSVAVLKGLVTWAQGDQAEAEKLFRSVLERTYAAADAHFYLAELLTARGDLGQAAAQRQLAEVTHNINLRHPCLASTYLRVDPINGGFTRAF